MADRGRLTRQHDGRIFGGVAVGLARYFNVDVTIVRIIFLILTLFNLFGVIAYVVMWLIMPDAEHTSGDPRDSLRANVDDFTSQAQQYGQQLSDRFGGIEGGQSRVLIGGVLVAVGGLIFLQQTLLPALNIRLGQIMWPIAFIVVGIILITRRR